MRARWAPRAEAGFLAHFTQREIHCTHVGVLSPGDPFAGKACSRRMRRVSLVGGICLLPDAISYSLLRKMQAIDASFGADEFPFRLMSTLPMLPTRGSNKCLNVGALLADPHFAQSSVVVYGSAFTTVCSTRS